MPTKRSHLSKIVLVSLFVFIALVEESDQHILRSGHVESPCLRRCLLRAVKRSKTKVSTFSCYRNCINRNNQDQEALTAIVGKQRSRKALKPNPECRDSSPSQSIDWSPSVVNVTFGQYENTSYWYVNVSWTPLNESYGNWTDVMVRLMVPGSSSFAIPVVCSVHPKNLTFLNINISSHHYEYPDSIFLKVLALPYSTKGDRAEILEYNPLGLTPTPTKVNTTDCSLQEYGDLEWSSKNVKGCFFERSNGDWFANISWTPLTNSTVSWTGYFLAFYFGDISKIKNYGTVRTCFQVPKNQTSYIVDSSHGWKPPQSISVSVSAYPFPEEMGEVMHSLKYSERCTSSTLLPDTLTAPPQSTSTTPPPGNSPPIATVFSGVTGGFVLVLIILLLVRHCRRIPTKSSSSPTTEPPRFKYHVFIMYSTIDSDFVENTLIPILERYSFIYCIHWKDFPPGEVFTRTIVQSVYNSFKIIAVLSENFKNSPPCQYEICQAKQRLMTQGDDCLIVIKIDGVNVTEVLGEQLLERSYIDYTSFSDRFWCESKLVQVLQRGVLEDQGDDCSEGKANNNNLTQEDSTGDGVQEVSCSCQSAV